MSCLCILEIMRLSVLSFANIFSHSIGCVFIFAYGFLCCAIAYKSDWSHLFIFAFISIALEDCLKNTLLRFTYQNVSPMFSSRYTVYP